MTKSRDDTHKHARVGGESALEVRRTWISTPLATNSGKADGLGGLGWQGCGGGGGLGGCGEGVGGVVLRGVLVRRTESIGIH